MEIEDVKRTVRIKQWAEMAQACLESGQTVKEWCAANSITTKTYYYRLRQVRLEALKKATPDIAMLPSQTKGHPIFAELVLAENGLAETQMKHPNAPAATVTIGRLTISIHNGAGPDVIACVIRAASEISGDASV